MHRYKKLTNPAIIAPLMKTSEGRINLPNRLNNFLDDCVSMFLFANKLYTHNKYSKIIDNGDRTMIVDLIPGSFMFVSAQIFEEIGYFNPSTFLYNEEAFIAHEVKIKGLKNYILLDVDYIHAHKSPTISKSYNTAGKYNLLYNSIVRYTLLYRKFPVFKILILRILKPFILLEKYLYDFIRNII